MTTFFETLLRKLGIRTHARLIHEKKNEQTTVLLELETQAKRALKASKQSVKESEKTLQLVRDKTYEIALATGAIIPGESDDQ